MEKNNESFEQKNRLVIDCSSAQANAFVSRLKKISEINLKSHKPPTDKVLQDRYTFTADIENISVVYETRADALIITASDHILSLLKREFEKIKATAAPKNEPTTVNKAVNSKPVKGNLPANINNDTKLLTEKNVRPTMLGNEKKIKNKSRKNGKNNELKEVKTNKIEAREIKNAILKPSKGVISPENSGRTNTQTKKVGEILSGVTRFKLESMLNSFSKNKNVQFSTDKNSFREGCEIYSAILGKSKVVIKYHSDKLMAQIDGKGGKLYDEIKAMLDAPPPKTRVDESKLKVVQNRLKKLLPNAFDVLNEQSLIDISIGMADINNDKVSLSDYSMLLVPPYRGLERLISDLQKARGIDVKMIGQAYEKQDGKYVLKSGYRKRINSHVYSEVMSALYTEYFEKRNFYTHSDIAGDLLSRVIANKNAVKTIFNNLIDLIEYNIFKLKEINFWEQTGF